MNMVTCEEASTYLDPNQYENKESQMEEQEQSPESQVKPALAASHRHRFRKDPSTEGARHEVEKGGQ
jgi:hypothetical protein